MKPEVPTSFIENGNAPNGSLGLGRSAASGRSTSSVRGTSRGRSKRRTAILISLKPAASHTAPSEVSSVLRKPGGSPMENAPLNAGCRSRLGGASLACARNSAKMDFAAGYISANLAVTIIPYSVPWKGTVIFHPVRPLPVNSNS